MKSCPPRATAPIFRFRSSAKKRVIDLGGEGLFRGQSGFAEDVSRAHYRVLSVRPSLAFKAQSFLEIESDH